MDINFEEFQVERETEAQHRIAIEEARAANWATVLRSVVEELGRDEVESGANLVLGGAASGLAADGETVRVFESVYQSEPRAQTDTLTEPGSEGEHSEPQALDVAEPSARAGQESQSEPTARVGQQSQPEPMARVEMSGSELRLLCAGKSVFECHYLPKDNEAVISWVDSERLPELRLAMAAISARAGEAQAIRKEKQAAFQARFKKKAGG